MAKKIPASNIEWKDWGVRDPLWAVAAWKGKSRNGVNPWTSSDFYKLGESDWEDFSAYWERYGVNKASVLEIGCGAGRITKPLVKYFQVVHAVDVSEGMIAYARAHVKAPSVNFHLSDGVRIPLPNQSVGAIFSSHVFQHFDSIGHSTEYFKEIHRVLQPSGTIMIHLPIFIWPFGTGRIIPVIYRLRKTFGNIKARLFRLLIRQYNLYPIMRGTSYTAEYIYKTLGELGYTEIEICIFPTKSNGGLHHFVFAKKNH